MDHAGSRPAVVESVIVVLGPLLLALVEIAHPHPGDLLQLDVRTWSIVHYAQIPLFAWAALALALSPASARGVCAWLCRAAALVFAASYIAFDTAAGVVAGILVDAAQRSSAPEAWRAAIDAVWKHPIVGGSPSGPPPLLAVLGAVAWSIGTVAAACAARREGRGWAPVAVLALSGFGLAIFRTHAFPGGPFTFGGFALAAAWLQWERSHERT